MGRYKIDCSGTGVYPCGVTVVADGIHAAVAVKAQTCALLLFRHRERGIAESANPFRIPFPPESRTGNVWEMTVRGSGLEKYDYAFEADGIRFPDPCGRSFIGRESWGRPDQHGVLKHSPVVSRPFDWEGDRPLHLPYEDCIVYRAHVRGFTKHASSRVKEKGTFAGIVEKIPYLQELGITTLELLPAAEFDEVMVPETADGNPYGTPEPTGKLNYWGYAPALFYAPKAAYAGTHRDPVTEMKTLVRALHKAGMELVLEMYFDGKESPTAVLDALRFWVREYHIDGFHLTGRVPGELLAADPYLADTKLWAASWDEREKETGQPKHLAVCNEDFLIDMRRVLKGDEDQMRALAWRIRRNPAGAGVINYIAGTNGFTMMDMVSYEQKHNEANGEGNHDGTDYNYTWNCGMEGPARKKKLVQQRRQQLRNAMLLLFLSQGTPMLLAGDEFGNSQNGNNNAYCQDNEISWLNWRGLDANRDIYQFARQVIAFRHAHPVFHMQEEPRLMDYRSCGCPDMSYHGIKPWVPEFESFRRQLGVLYCGEYVRKTDGMADDYFFVMYNMHWEAYEFALPRLPEGLDWHVAFDTTDVGHNRFFAAGEEPLCTDKRTYLVLARAIVVLIGKKGQKTLTNQGETDINR
ncbi:MAG: alpha-amylase [Clostridiales bacterium]|nr:alpha-amylase [Clostridiales bacterium]